MKPRKPVDPERLRRRVEKAIFALRRSVVIAGRQEWTTPGQSSILNENILQIEQTFMVVLPAAPETESESGACLPF
jgi:hypothetical protein